jgi:hypothetical protein
MSPANNHLNYVTFANSRILKGSVYCTVINKGVRTIESVGQWYRTLAIEVYLFLNFDN